MPSPPETPPKPTTPQRLEPGDFYYDGPYLVFTAAYHLRRGHCCQSGCRHCPYGFKEKQTANHPPESDVP